MRKSDAAVKAKAESVKEKDEEKSVTPGRRSAIRLKTRPKGPPGLPAGPPGLPKGPNDTKETKTKTVDGAAKETKKVKYTDLFYSWRLF